MRKLDENKDYGVIYGVNSRGARYEQDGLLFDGAKQCINDAPEPEPEPEPNALKNVIPEPEIELDIEPPVLREKEAAVAKEVSIAERVLIVDENVNGYMDRNEIKAALDELGVNYSKYSRRSSLIKTLQEAID